LSRGGVVTVHNEELVPRRHELKVGKYVVAVAGEEVDVDGSGGGLVGDVVADVTGAGVRWDDGIGVYSIVKRRGGLARSASVAFDTLGTLRADDTLGASGALGTGVTLIALFTFKPR